MGLYAVALLVVVGEVQKLQTEVGPLTLHGLRIQSPDLHHHILYRQLSTAVCTLVREMSCKIHENTTKLCFCLSVKKKA